MTDLFVYLLFRINIKRIGNHITISARIRISIVNNIVTSGYVPKL